MRKRVLTLAAILGITTGCNTIATQHQFWSGDFEHARLPLGMVYSGTAMDFVFLRGSDWTTPGPDRPWTPPFLVDLPLCLVLDTALLPVTIGESIALRFRGSP